MENRRGFLRKLLGGAAAVTASPLVTKGDQLAKEFHEAMLDGTETIDDIDFDKIQASGTMVTGSLTYDGKHAELLPMPDGWYVNRILSDK